MSSKKATTLILTENRLEIGLNIIKLKHKQWFHKMKQDIMNKLEPNHNLA